MHRVLIVDDQPDIRQLVGLSIAGIACEVLEAASGPEALALAARTQPDLVLLDGMMPGDFDGFETCRRIKADPRTYGRPQVALLTALSQRSDRERGINAGADDYIVKPFSPLDLRQQVQDILARGPRARRADPCTDIQAA